MRTVIFYFVLPVAGPVFFVVGLRQALTGRGVGDAQRGTPPSNDVRRHSLLLAVGLAAAFAFVSWAWLRWALPPHEPGERIAVALLVGDVFSSLVLFPWVVISAYISQRMDRSAHRPR